MIYLIKNIGKIRTIATRECNNYKKKYINLKSI